jgi:hypothetical protein
MRKRKNWWATRKNPGREWHPQGEAEDVRVYDFPIKGLGRATPYGVYDLGRNVGWVNVGIDHDTAAFAVQSIRSFWNEVGRQQYPQAKRLLISADGGGSNGSRVRLWKWELQQLADETGLAITVCHLPPGTSKWNKIEHRLFAWISQTLSTANGTTPSCLVFLARKLCRIESKRGKWQRYGSIMLLKRRNSAF